MEDLGNFPVLGSIGGNFDLRDNANLEDLGNFPVLGSIGGNFFISNNNNLEDVGDFPALTRINRSFQIIANNHLEDLGNFPVLERIGGLFGIRSNANLEDMGSFPSLTTIGGHVNIRLNDHLIYLYDFPALTSIGSGFGDINITKTSVEFIENLSIVLQYNSSLKYCCVLENFRLGGDHAVLGEIHIERNAAGCNSASEATCGPSVEFSSDTIRVPFYSTDTAFLISSNTRWRLQESSVDWVETFSASGESPRDSLMGGRLLTGSHTPVQVNYQLNLTSSVREVGLLVSSLDSTGVTTLADTLTLIQEKVEEILQLESANPVKVSHLADSTEIVIRSNVRWRLRKPSDTTWMRLSSAAEHAITNRDTVIGNDIGVPSSRFTVVTLSYEVLPTAEPRSVELVLEIIDEDGNVRDDLVSDTLVFTQAIPPYSRSITLTTQQAVDTIRATLGDPRITVIAGNLTIGPSDDITNLSPLNFLTEITGEFNIGNFMGGNAGLVNTGDFSVLERVGGDFTIQNNANLENVGDFPVLERIGGEFFIQNNANLENVGDFSVLERIGEGFFITNNANLEDAGDFPALERIGGSFFIRENANLKDLGDFPALERIGGVFFIQENANLKDLGDFPALERIDWNFFIQENANLEGVGSFPSLTTIGQYFSIRSNDNLVYLYDFPLLTSIGSARGDFQRTSTVAENDDNLSITIQDNPLLKYCCVLTNFRSGGTYQVSGSVYINRNASGCSSDSEATCNSFVDVLQVDDTLQVPFHTTDTTFMIVSNARWQLSKQNVDADWITMLSAGEESHSNTIMGGQNGELTYNSVTISYEETPTSASRSAELVLVAIDENGHVIETLPPVTITITQTGFPSHTGDITLINQQAVNTIRNTLSNPRITAIKGNLIIGHSSDITDLSPLDFLTEITGNFEIGQDGMTNGVPNGNSALVDIGDFPFLQKIGGRYYVTQNTNLVNGGNFPVLEKIGGVFFIRDNDKLESMGAFPRLKSIGTYFSIRSNGILPSLYDFPALTSIGMGTAWVPSSNSGNGSTVDGVSIVVENNSLLAHCCVLTKFRMNDDIVQDSISISGSIHISGNVSGCNSTSDASCNSFVTFLQTDTLQVSFHTTDTTFTIVSNARWRLNKPNTGADWVTMLSAGEESSPNTIMGGQNGELTYNSVTVNYHLNGTDESRAVNLLASFLDDINVATLDDTLTLMQEAKKNILQLQSPNKVNVSDSADNTDIHFRSNVGWRLSKPEGASWITNFSDGTTSNADTLEVNIRDEKILATTTTVTISYEETPTSASRSAELVLVAIDENGHVIETFHPVTITITQTGFPSHTGDMTLINQTQVNDIRNTLGNPRITAIKGNLIIGSSSDITDLSPLSFLTEITGNFEIGQDGMTNGVPNGNSALVDIGDFPFLQKIGGGYHVTQNTNLVNGGNFPVLDSIGGYFFIRENANLEGVGSFPSLTTIGQYFSIRSNDNLVYLYDFPLLTSIGSARGDFQRTSTVAENDDNLSITIQDNPLLKYCCVLTNFRSGGTYQVSGSVYINRNASGCSIDSEATCNSFVDVLQVDDTLQVPFHTTDTTFTIVSNSRWRLNKPSADADWITMLSAEEENHSDSVMGGKNGELTYTSVTVSYHQNNTITSRKVNLFLSFLDMNVATLDDTLTLMQEAKNNILQLQSPNKVEVSHSSGSTDIHFRSNVGWRLSKPEGASWITNFSDGTTSNTDTLEVNIRDEKILATTTTVTISYEETPTSASRSAELVLVAIDENGHVIETFHPVTITITQAGFPSHTGDITLIDQQAVDTIRNTLGDPRITAIKGNLIIGHSNNITDLSPLDFLTEITGNFEIGQNGNTGSVPNGNSDLVDIGDFPFLQKIGGGYYVTQNTNLVNGGNFPALDSIGGYFFIRDNDKLESVGTFPRLKSIGTYFSMRSNGILPSLYDFPALTSIGTGSAWVPSSNSGNGSTVDSVSIVVENNSLLAHCCVLTKFRMNDDIVQDSISISGSIHISGNVSGCNSTSDASCNSFVTFLQTDTLQVSFHTTDTTFTIVSNARWRLNKPNTGADWVTMLSAGEESHSNTIMGGQNGELTYTSVTVNYHLNRTDESRAVNLLASFLDDINVATLDDTLTLMQEAKKNILQLQSPNKVEVSHSSGSTDIHFRSNVGWRLSKPEGASWITNFSDGTTSNADTLEVNIRDEKILATTTTVTISYEETPTSASRSAELVLVAIDENGHVIETLPPVTITITQTGFPSHTGDITLTTQQAVDTIRNTLGDPRITAIKGNLIIGHSSDITDLSPLDFLTEITGNFEIGQDGMTNGVPNGNSALVDIGDFPFLQKIGGGYYVTQNTNLVNGGNFPVLDSIGGYFFIRENANLEGVGSFPTLTTIGQYFSIRSNDNLVYLYDFPLLTSIGSARGDFQMTSTVVENDDNLSITIQDNPLLKYCCVLTNFRSGGTYQVSGSVYINRNASGCSSDSEATCNSFVDVLQVDDTLQVPFHTTDTTFTIVSNARWRLNKPSADADWITMLSAGEENHSDSVMGGKNGELTYTSVTVSYHQNNTITSRKVNLFLSFLDMNVATLDDTLTLMQEATSNVLQLLSPSEVNVSDSADNTDIAIRSNVGWRLSKPEGVNWITNFSDGTTSNADTLEVNIGDEKILATTTTVTISYEETPTSASRSAELVLVAIDENGHVIETFHPVTITITQAGFPSHTEDITLTTQQAVNTIRNTLSNPRITAIKGNLIIGHSSDITDLSPLDFLTEITGNFEIGQDGMTNGVPNGNSALVDIGDFPFLQKIGGGYYVTQNTNLVNGGNFPVLDSIGGYFFIRDNDKLESVGTFPRLKSIGTYFSMRSNGILPSLYDFPALTSIGTGSAWVPSSNSGNGSTVDGVSIVVENNSLLAHCCVLTKFRMNDDIVQDSISISGSIHISGNVSGCNSTSDASCNSFVTFLQTDTLQVSFHTTDTTFTIVSNARWRLNKPNTGADWVTMLSAGEESSPNTIMGGQNGELTYTSVTVSYHPNSTDESRTGNLLVSFLDDMNMATLDDTLILMQEAKNNILQLQPPNKVEVSHSSGSTDIHFRSNVRWRLRKPQDATWMTLSAENTITSGGNLMGDDNEVLASRVNVVTLSYEELPADTLHRNIVLVLEALDENGNVLDTPPANTLMFTQSIPPYTGSITLLNQEQVNNIHTTLGDPRITAIKGNLTIGSSIDITDLSPLNFLTEITGNFKIGINSGNIALVDIGIFPVLRRIGGNFEIRSNNKLEDAGDFPVLERIGGYFLMRFNSKLENIVGFPELNSIKGNFFVSNNNNLKDMGDFPELDSIGGYFLMRFNPQLERVGSFSSLVDVGGYFSVNTNNSLRYLYNFPALMTINRENSAAEKVVITNNPLLEYCCVLTKFRSGGIYPVSPDSVLVNNNATGCNSIDDANCDPLVMFLQTDTLQVPFYTTDTTFMIVSNSRWRLSADTGWVEMLSVGGTSHSDSVMGGKNGELTYTSVTVSYHQNNAITSRKVNLFLSFLDMNVATLSDTLTLMQEATSNVLQLLSPSEVNVSHSSGSTEIRFRSNVRWRLRKPQDATWMTLSAENAITTSEGNLMTDDADIEATFTVVTLSYEELPTSASRSIPLVLEALDGDGNVLNVPPSSTLMFTQSVLPYIGNITLRTQQAVNTIHATLGDPRITAIKGNLTIGSSSNITDLSPLNFLTEITGNFIIDDNSALIDMGDFPVLQKIGGNYHVIQNDNLIDMGDFPVLQKIGGNYHVIQNDNLIDVGRFPELDSIGGYFEIEENIKLENVGHFPSLVDIGKYFSVNANDSLRYLYDFPALMTIRGGGASLPFEVRAMEEIKIVVADNASLEYCCVLTKFRLDGTYPVSDSAYISGNATMSCNNVDRASCDLFVDLSKGNTLMLPDTSSNFDFTVSSNGRWKLIQSGETVDWVTLSIGDNTIANDFIGGINTTITRTSVRVNHSQNELYNARTVNLLIVFLDKMGNEINSSNPDTLTIIQEENQIPKITLTSHTDGENDSIAYDNIDTITLNFTLEGSATNSISNISYTPENANFITLQPENNNEATRTITITPTANTTTEQRTATITLNTTGHEGTPDNVSLTITQSAEPIIMLTSHTSGENITIAHDNTNSITLDFILGGISNFMSSISYMPENANFITSQLPSNNDEIISIMIAPSANTTTEQRTATITVNTTGHKGTPASVSLTITQETVPTLILTSKRTDSIIHNDTETKNIDFTVGGSATGWISDIVYTPRNTNFITLSPEKDTTQTGSITIMASPIENTDNEKRMATITLSTTGHLGTPARDTFTIVQKAKPTITLRNNNSSIQKDHTIPIIIRFTVGGSAKDGQVILIIYLKIPILSH